MFFYDFIKYYLICFTIYVFVATYQHFITLLPIIYDNIVSLYFTFNII